ncbi:MAG: NAD(P)H-binding protein [Acidobacteriota bacterium]
MTTAALNVVFGCSGPVGVTLMEELMQRGRHVRGVCRSGRSEAPPGAEIVAGDAADAAAARRLAEGAEVVFACIGLPYPRWREGWPPLVEGLLSAAEDKRLIFADNLYAYGPVQRSLHEGLPPTTFGRKPALRARMTFTMLAAHRAGRTRVALVRASDLYGPRVRNSVLGERVFPAALEGRRAQLLADVDQPHAYTYVLDFARALARLGDEEQALGQIWHVPNAPARTTREVVETVYRLAGNKPRIRVMPSWQLKTLALVSPLMRELKELEFQRDRPYLVEDRRTREAFGIAHTALEEGLATTLDWYRQGRTSSAA